MTEKKRHKSTSESVSETLRELIPYTHLGWQLLASILLFFGIGYGLDYLLDTGSLLTVIFACVGIVFGLYSVIKTANDIHQRKN
ncbi:MAG: hypothetical protein C0600_16000 [Ignavibacteria bacterium]|nr:MAG: hypothetical protein C0600_16000 [Ignavibacteria bacterium]